MKLLPNSILLIGVVTFFLSYLFVCIYLCVYECIHVCVYICVYVLCVRLLCGAYSHNFPLSHGGCSVLVALVQLSVGCAFEINFVLLSNSGLNVRNWVTVIQSIVQFLFYLFFRNTFWRSVSEKYSCEYFMMHS